MAGVRAAALNTLIVVATAVGVWWPPRARGTARGSGGHPGWWLLVVTGAIYLNQVLFTVYVRRVHHGDPAFIARYLPAGWFDLADLGPLPDLFPAPELLGPTVLRVQAFLELPFVLLAYLTVCRWLGSEVHRRAVRMVWPAALAYTAVFVLVELALPNPYTVDDVIIRVLSASVTGLVLSRWPGPPAAGRVDTPGRMLAFLAAAGAMG
jgi:hypothetical protein